MDGSYSTLIRSDKQIYWELKMVLHVPQLISGAYYMLWHQIYDEPLSNKKSDYNDYWEDYTCSI